MGQTAHAGEKSLKMPKNIGFLKDNTLMSGSRRVNRSRKKFNSVV